MEINLRNLACVRFLEGRAYFFAIVSISFLVVFQASAQVTKQTCPSLGQDATAEEQAVCWFQREKSNSLECEGQNGESSACISQTNAWCSQASLDAEPVATACLLAAIRSGQLKEAKEIAGYLRNPSKTAEACAAVLKRAGIRIVTNPAGAEVIVNGHSYGNAPIEVRLVGDWWESDVKARFATDPKTVEVAVSSDELLNTFDKEECVFGDLVITGPKLEPPTPPQVNQNNGLSDSKQLSIESNDSDWLLWTSISLAVAGVASGVVATTFLLDADSDNRYLKQECPDGCYEGDIETYVSSMDKKYLVGNIFVVTGSVCLAAALATAALFFSETDSEAKKTDIDLVVGSAKMKFSARF